MAATIKQKNPGWLDRLKKRRKSSKIVAVGFPAGEAGGLRYPDGTAVIDVATYNNFGTDKIPRRDFMTPGGQKANEATAGLRKDIVKRVDAGQGDIDQDWDKIGAVGAAQIQLTIRDLKDPPNAPSTIAQKGEDKPLQDNGLLIQSVTFEVRGK